MKSRLSLQRGVCKRLAFALVTVLLSFAASSNSWAGEFSIYRSDTPNEYSIVYQGYQCRDGVLDYHEWSFSVPSDSRARVAIVSIEGDTLFTVDTVLAAGAHRAIWSLDSSRQATQDTEDLVWLCIETGSQSTFPSGRRKISSKIISATVERDASPSGGGTQGQTCPALARWRYGNDVPTGFSMSVAYPNPFAGSFPPAFALPCLCQISLIVKDTAENIVHAYEECTLPGGRYQPCWDCPEGPQDTIPSGVYYYELTAATIAGPHRSTFFVRMPYLLLR